MNVLSRGAKGKGAPPEGIGTNAAEHGRSHAVSHNWPEHVGGVLHVNVSPLGQSVEAEAISEGLVMTI